MVKDTAMVYAYEADYASGIDFEKHAGDSNNHNESTPNIQKEDSAALIKIEVFWGLFI